MYSPVLDNTSVVDSPLKDTHMSLEQAISDNTAAIYELISTLTNQAKQVTLDLTAPKYDALPTGTVTLTGFSPLLESLPWLATGPRPAGQPLWKVPYAQACLRHRL